MKIAILIRRYITTGGAERYAVEVARRLAEKHGDLKKCLQALLAELQSGARQCKLYRQFKMYNDASLNPQLYQKPE